LVKAMKNGKEVSLVVDSSGQVQERRERLGLSSRQPVADKMPVLRRRRSAAVLLQMNSSVSIAAVERPPSVISKSAGTVSGVISSEGRHVIPIAGKGFAGFGAARGRCNLV
jgi:hypothetical protein